MNKPSKVRYVLAKGTKMLLPPSPTFTFGFTYIMSEWLLRFGLHGLTFLCFTFARVLGLPSEEDWPKDSPISYSVSWGPEVSCTKLLQNLGPYENDLLAVSNSVFCFVLMK